MRRWSGRSKACLCVEVWGSVCVCVCVCVCWCGTEQQQQRQFLFRRWSPLSLYFLCPQCKRVCVWVCVCECVCVCVCLFVWLCECICWQMYFTVAHLRGHLDRRVHLFVCWSMCANVPRQVECVGVCVCPFLCTEVCFVNWQVFSGHNLEPSVPFKNHFLHKHAWKSKTLFIYLFT